MKGKIIGLGASIILIVGVAIGLVVHNANKPKPNANNNNSLLTTSKPVATFCGATDHKELCAQSLESVAKNESATTMDYVEAVINVTIDAVKDTIGKSHDIGKGANDPLDQMAFEDCKELFELAVDELQAALAHVNGNNNNNNPNAPPPAAASDDEMTDNERMVTELKNWLSATVSYQQSCVEGIFQVDLREQMSKGMVNASQLTSNLLAIVSEIVPVLNNLGIQMNVSLATSRHLSEKVKKPKKAHVHKDKKPPGGTDTNTPIPNPIDANNPKPNAIVAQDGSGQFKTITDALKAYPKVLQGRHVIYVKAGIYNEHIIITKDQINIFMYGDGPTKSIVTGRLNNREGVSTYQTATFAVIGNGFICKDMGFQNTAGAEGHQAVALRVQSDMSVFYNCRMDGYQDTLYTQAHRQFYRNCVISGTIDFIFGDGSAMIQNSLIIVRKPMEHQQNTVTAQGKADRRETTGIVIQNCRIVPDQDLFPVRFNFPTFLGRPWKEYSTTVIMQSELADLIQPPGWMPWGGTFALDTCFYAEYANHGPGADTSRRVKWKGFHVITNERDAMPFTVGPFIQGEPWISITGLPFITGLKI